MVRPEGESGGFGRRSPSRAGGLLAVLAVFAGLDVAIAAPGAAISEPLSMQLARGRPDAASPGRAAGEEARTMKLAGHRDGGYGPEQRAQELYLDGMDKLEAGHREWASRTFDELIARFPETSAATLARNRLRELRKGGSAQPAVLTGAPAELETPRLPAARPPALHRAPVWEQELRRNAPIQSKLREQAGDRVFFAAGSAELGSRARVALAAQARWLNAWHEFEAAIVGHADEPGSDEENFRLSMQRAEAVRRRLVEEGVDAARLAIVAAGLSEPIAICESAACQTQNRRVVTLVFTSGTHKRLGLAAPPATRDALSLSPTAAAAEPANTQAPVPVDATH